MLLSEKDKRKSIKRVIIETSSRLNVFHVQQLMSNLLDQGFGGAALVIVTTAIYHLLFASDEYEIIAHPVNQSGSSRQQFSDLDLLKDGKPFIGTELKDKPFSTADVDHAAENALKAGASSLLFVAGRQSSFAAQPQTYFMQIREKYANEGFYVGVTSIDSLLDFSFASNMTMNPKPLLTILSQTAEDIGALEAQMWIYKQIEYLTDSFWSEQKTDNFD